jgi:lambda repressor-like predicted transcriptional regulator
MTNQQCYAEIRAGFVSKGTSLHKWCKQNGYHRQNAYAAIMGEWVGDKASELCRLLMA